MTRKRHKTPAKLDYLFQRQVISRTQYNEFWSEYWSNKGKRSKEKYVDYFISKLQLELPSVQRQSGTITHSRRQAEKQAKEIGGYVVRRNRKGQFSRTGKSFQAIKRRNKK